MCIATQHEHYDSIIHVVTCTMLLLYWWHCAIGNSQSLPVFAVGCGVASPLIPGTQLSLAGRSGYPADDRLHNNRR